MRREEEEWSPYHNFALALMHNHGQQNVIDIQPFVMRSKIIAKCCVHLLQRMTYIKIQKKGVKILVTMLAIQEYKITCSNVIVILVWCIWHCTPLLFNL
jgi:hypothetical protein